MKRIQSISTGEFVYGTKNDCVVRAIANVTMMEYKEAENLLSEHGRKHNKGTKLDVLISTCEAAGLKEVKRFGTTSASCYMQYAYGNKFPIAEKGITLENFCKKYNSGRYVVLYKGHALAVINGNIVDTFNNLANKRVFAVFSAKPF